MLSISIRFIKHFGEVHLVGEVWYAYLILKKTKVFDIIKIDENLDFRLYQGKF